MIEQDAHINIRLPAELLEVVDAAAAGRRASRSALIRAVLEDALDAGELPSVKDTLDTDDGQIADAQFERLRELTCD